MPQPGDRVKWSGRYHFGSTALASKSAMSQWIGIVISDWSGVDMNLGRILATILGTRSSIIMSVYSESRSYATQREILRKAADECLNKTDAGLLENLLGLLAPAASIRNKFAHGIWGISLDPKLDALLLVEQKDLFKLTIAQRRHIRRTRNSGPHDLLTNMPQLNVSDIQIYRLNDLERAGKQLDLAYGMTEAFRSLVESDGDRRCRIRKYLKNEYPRLKGRS